MKVARPAALPDIAVIDPVVHEDGRGFLLESWHLERYRDAGIPGPFVQDVHSHSVRDTLRGLHFQHPHAQGKIVRVTRGAVFDVAVDVRRGSPTFGRWWSTELSEENRRQLWIPPGFAHGFLTLSDAVDFLYRCTDYYAREAARVIAWDDPALAIDWPHRRPLLSDADARAPSLAELAERGLLPEYAG